MGVDEREAEGKENELASQAGMGEMVKYKTAGV